jgi:hypothetical protein
MQNVINKTKNNQLITAGIKVSCNCKRSLYIWRKITNSPIIRAFYTKYTTLLKKVIRKAKHLYYDKLTKTFGNKNKTLWKTINTETGKSNLTKNITMEFNLGSTSHNNPANVFNKYSLNIIDELRIQQANIVSTKFPLKEAFPWGFPDIINTSITESDVKCTIKVF